MQRFTKQYNTAVPACTNAITGTAKGPLNGDFGTSAMAPLITQIAFMVRLQEDRHKSELARAGLSLADVDVDAAEPQRRQHYDREYGGCCVVS